MTSSDYREGARAFLEKRRPTSPDDRRGTCEWLWFGVDVGGTFTDLVLFDRDAAAI